MVSKTRFGIIGCSRIAESSVIPAIQNSKFAEVQMIGSRSIEKAEKFANKFKCKNYGSYEEVLSNDKVDAVYISIPVGLHEDWTIKASQHGKHVLCEKSSTVSYESAWKMVESCKKNNVRLMEGFMFRFHPQHAKVKQLINERYLGDLFSFVGAYGFPPISRDDIRFKKDLGGGILNDAGCYPICASRIIFDEEPIGIFCNLTIDKESQVDTRASLYLKYSGIKNAQISVGYDLFYQSTYSLWGTEGSIRLFRSYNISPELTAKMYLDSNIGKQEISIEPSNHFLLMINSFCNQIQNISVHKFNSEDDLLKQAKIMQAARISDKENSFVKLEELDF